MSDNVLARIGHKILNPTPGMGGSDWHERIKANKERERAQEQALREAGMAANYGYMMNAPAWEREAIIMGAATQLQQKALSDIQSDIDRYSDPGRRDEHDDQYRRSVDKYRERSHEKAMAAAIEAQQNAAKIMGAVNESTYNGGRGYYVDDAGNVSGEGDPVMWGEGLLREAGVTPDAIAARAYEQALREMGWSDEVSAPVAPAEGEPAPEWNLTGDKNAKYLGRRNRAIERDQQRVAELAQQQIMAAGDLNPYAREAAPYLGLPPEYALGMYPDDPMAGMQQAAEQQAYANYLETGDPSGRSAEELALEQYRDQRDLAEMRGDMQSDSVLEANLLDAGTDIGGASAELGISANDTMSALGDPAWGAYQAELGAIYEAMPDASWSEVKSELDMVGFAKPSGAMEKALAGLWRRLADGNDGTEGQPNGWSTRPGG